MTRLPSSRSSSRLLCSIGAVFSMVLAGLACGPEDFAPTAPAADGPPAPDRDASASRVPSDGRLPAPVDGAIVAVDGPPAPDGGAGSPPDAGPDAPAAPVPLVCGPEDAVRLVGDRSVLVGKTAGAAIVGCAGPLRDVVWRQSSGPAVELLAGRTQAISFDPPEPGTYVFAVSYRQADGAASSGTATITALAPGSASRITVRSDQAVRSLGNASVRAWPTLVLGEVMAGISWQQLEGPMVKLDLSDPRRIVFRAPDVARDTVLAFRATVRTTGGDSDSDDVVVLVEGAPPPAPDGLLARTHISRVHPYRSSSKYADRLGRCVFDAQLTASNGCPLSTLPLIGQETPPDQLPTVDQIMDRVLVSHDWIGANFQEFLRTQDPDGDFRRMFAAVTGVVIGAHVRPPLYYGSTGAIYLDADDLWLTAEQRDLIDEAADYRLGFGDGLRFSALVRWTTNNSTAWPYYRRDIRASRGLASITNEFGRVLYHELTHATDFFPPSIHRTLDSSKTPNDLYLPRYRAGQLPSSLLAARLPLTSTEMSSLGQVLFAGVMPSDRQKGFAPIQVAEFFRADRANDTYNYSTAREDLAMLVEEFMMAHRRGLRRDVAITNRYMTGLTSDQLIVSWGQRGRIGDPLLKVRLQLALDQIVPWIDSSAVDALPPPIAMPSGASWYATVQLPAAPATSFDAPDSDLDDGIDLLEKELRRRAQHPLDPP
jgi:hypothetical protein